jgi:cytochrome c
MTARRVIGLAALAALAVTACDKRDDSARAGASAPPNIGQAASPGDTPRAVDLRSRYHGIGRRATDAEIRAWNIDVNASGAGLPPGRGTYARGVQVFAERCAMCHGALGEGIAANPRLIGAEPRDFSFASDAKIPKTIGNYWPFATTLYDYINRAMPFPAPGSLPPADVYSVIAFLLAENKVIDTSTVMDARSLPRVHMPARDRFVMDNRSGGPTFR